MGAIVRAECSCGYHTSNRIDNTGRLIVGEEVLIGNGMRTRGIHYYPALCRTCREVVTMNLERVRLSCPVCSGPDVIPYYEPRMGCGKGQTEIPCSVVCVENEMRQEIEYALYEDIDYLCPRCGSNRLRLRCCGLWD